MASPYDFMNRESNQPGMANPSTRNNAYAMPNQNSYGVDTSMGGGAQPQTRQQGMVQTGGYRGAYSPGSQGNAYGSQPQTGGYKGSAQVYQPGTGVPGRSLLNQGQSAQPTSRTTTEWQPSPGATMPTIAQTQTQPGQNGWQAGPGATMPQTQQQGNGQPTANPDPYGQPWVDYMNPDGSPHINYQYGQNSGGGGQRGPTGPNGGSNDYWTGGGQPQREPVGGGQNDHGPMYGNIPQGPGQQGLPFTWDQYAAARNDNPRIAQEWAQMQLPYQQLQQNAYQYDRDFGESIRRDDRNYGLTQQGQYFDQGMQTRQQDMAENVFNVQTGQWERQQTQAEGNDRFNQNMATNQFDRDGRQWNQTFGLQQNQQNFQQGMDTRGMNLQELNSNRQYGLDNRGMNMQELNSNRQYGLDTRGMNLQELQNSQQYGLSQNAQAQQAAQFAAQLGLDTRGMTLQEVTQATQAAYQQQQLSQQANLTREGYASQERQAVMAATGRQQAPQARWVRSW